MRYRDKSVLLLATDAKNQPPTKSKKTTMAISLKIKGNKRTNEGIGNDLVSIGDNRFPVTDAQYPGTNGATDFIVMRHLPDKSIYTIVSKNVTPCDSNREGTLYISVCVPAKEQVEGLFNMLIELQNAYKSTCMTYDGTMYHFLARNDMPQPFEEIISRRHTLRYPYKTIATSSELSKIAYLFMTPEQISDLLNDPMRGEFSRYGEIVLIPVADPTQHVSTLNVPSKIWRSYKITVNGRPTGQTLADPTKTVTITLPETKTHESVSTTFTLQQAREKRMTGITIDDEAQVIYINMQPKLKPIPPEPIVIPVSPQEPSATGIVKHKKLIYAIAAVALAVIVGVAVYMLFLAPAEADDDKAKDAITEQINNGIHHPIDSITKDKNQTDSVDGAVGGNDKNGEDLNGKTGENTESNQGADKSSPGNGDGTDAQNTQSQGAKDAKLLQQYQKDRNDINNLEGLTFRKVKGIISRSKEYKGMQGFDDFKAKLDLAKRVIAFIETLTENIPSDIYTSKINGFMKEAAALGLNGFKTKLSERIKSPSDITKSKKNNTTF